MDLKEFRKIIASYIVESNLVVRDRHSSVIKFLKDAKEYKRVNVYFELECVEPTILKDVQYYHLEENQLINYFSYRTAIRKKQVPKNNYVTFLQIYLTEILSSLYSSEYKDTLKLIKYLEKISPKTLKFTNLLQTAYEVIYFQHYEELKDIKYFKEIDIPIFVNKEIVYKNGEWTSPVCFVIFNIFNLDSYSKYNNNTKYIFEKCFEYVYYKLKDEQFKFNTSDYLNVEFDRFFENTIYETSFTPYDNLISYSTLDVNIVLIDNIYKKIDYFIKGVHKTIQVHFRDEFKSYIKQFAIILLDSINHQCGGNKLPLFFYGNTYISFDLKSKITEKLRVQTRVDDLVVSWLKDNSYARKGFYLPYEHFIGLENNEEPLEDSGFSFNSDEIDKIRQASSNIQDKLIVEESDDCFDDLAICKEIEEEERDDDNSYEELESIIKDVNSTISNNSVVEQLNIDANIVENSIDTDPFKELFDLLSENERIITALILNDRVEEAQLYAIEKGEMLSLIVDSINTKSDDILGDIIIINNEAVDDYRSELFKLFNSNE
ncbi:MAG: hypothetical protein JJE21_09970 [Spirochaetaceae bacterium]|nr:hypothetical protein [Spirochaetaceae bacterium]